MLWVWKCKKKMQKMQWSKCSQGQNQACDNVWSILLIKILENVWNDESIISRLESLKSIIRYLKYRFERLNSRIRRINLIWNGKCRIINRIIILIKIRIKFKLWKISYWKRLKSAIKLIFWYSKFRFKWINQTKQY